MKKKFIVLTLTTNPKDDDEESIEEEEEEKLSGGRFGLKGCECLSSDTYVILHTKIFVSREFIKFYSLNIGKKNNEIEHNCLEPDEFLKLKESLEFYGNESKKRLNIITLGIGGGKLKEADNWITLQ